MNNNLTSISIDLDNIIKKIFYAFYSILKNKDLVYGKVKHNITLNEIILMYNSCNCNPRYEFLYENIENEKILSFILNLTNLHIFLKENTYYEISSKKFRDCIEPIYPNFELFYIEDKEEGVKK